MKLSVRSPDELVAAIPHFLGFTPHQSLVVVPFTPELPVARLDIPTTPAERGGAWESIRSVYARHAQPGSAVGLVAFSANPDHAEHISRDFPARFAALGITTPIRLWTKDTQWSDLATGATGSLTNVVRDDIAARSVFDGRAQPAASRDALADSLAGDPAPVAALLLEARTSSGSSTLDVETKFAVTRLEGFQRDGNRLTDPDAARLLVAIENLSIRDELWNDMTSDNATSHVALWRDLTRRAPDEVKATPATMLAFASWLDGHGALAWCALDQVPHEQPYSAAELVTSLVQNGVHPSAWADIKSAANVARCAAPVPPSSANRPSQQPPTL